jgi:hypothetical protein
MWPKDVGTWGIVLGALALLLAVPLSIIGNILTPKFLNWWAERSIESLQKRIDKSEDRLREYDLLF